MKEKTFNYTMKYYLFQMGRLKALTIFSWIFAVLGFPLICISANLISYSNEFDDIIIPLTVVGYICVVGIAFMSFITPLAALKHLYTKTSADNILSLPLTAAQRFIGDIGAILSSYSLPMLVSAVLSLICENITVNALGKQTTPEIYMFAFLAFTATLQFIALNTAITTVCGRMAEAILYPFVVNVIMPLTLICGAMIAYTDCFGVYDGMTDLTNSVVMNIFPLAILFAGSYETVFLPALIFAVIYFALTYFGYTKRCAQNIGKPFVFKHSYIITSTLVGLCFIVCYTYISELAPLRGDNIPVTILTIGIVLLIVMVIMEVLNYRKIHSVPKFALHFAATMGGGLLLCLLLVESGGFGVSYYVPEVKEVEKVGIYANYNKAEWENGIVNDFAALNEKDIKLITDEHQHIVDTYDPEAETVVIDPENYVYNSTSIDYKKNNGTFVCRNYYSYNGSMSIPAELWTNIFQSESYRLDAINTLENWSNNSSKKKTEVRFVNRHSEKMYLSFTDMDIMENEVVEALEKDLKADTEYGRHDENPVGLLQFGKYPDYVENGTTTERTDLFNPSVHIIIYESYTNTLEALSKYGTVPTVEEATADSVKNSDVFMLYRKKTGGIDVPAEEILGSDDGSSAVFITAEEFKELTSKQVKYNNYDGNQEYTYYVTRGMWYYMQQVLSDKIIEAIEKDATALPNYDFLEDSSNYGNYYIDMMINTEYNDLCGSLFEGRTVFTLNEDEFGSTIVIE